MWHVSHDCAERRKRLIDRCDRDTIMLKKRELKKEILNSE